MSAATATPPPAAPVTGPQVYRFTGEQYDRMAEVGVLGPDDNAELLAGFVVTKSPLSPPHAGTIRLTSKLVRQRLLLPLVLDGVAVASIPAADLLP